MKIMQNHVICYQYDQMKINNSKRAFMYSDVNSIKDG